MFMIAGAMHRILDTVFEADFTTQMPGVGDLTNFGLLYERLSGQSTVRTGSSTVASGGSLDSANSVPICKRADADLPGLLIEEGRTNFMHFSRAMTGNGWSGSSGWTLTSNAANGPDGTANADRNQVTSGGLSNFNQDPSSPSAGTYSVSLWHKEGSSGAIGTSWARPNGTGTVTLVYLNETAAWSRDSAKITGVSSSLMFTPVDGENLTSIGGRSAGARDVLTDLMQVELGAFPTEPIICTGTATTRAAPRLWKASGTSVLASDSSLRFYCEGKPSGAATEYSDDMTLWYGDSSNHVEIDYVTQAIKITIGGTLYTTPVSMSWNRYDTVRIWCAAGGNNLCEVKYSVNASSPITLSTGSPHTYGAITLSGNVDFFQANKTKIFSGIAQRVRTYKPGRKPVSF